MRLCSACSNELKNHVVLSKYPITLILPTDSPDTYEKRIRPLLLGVPNNDATALSFLKNHLTGDFYTWMKIANPADIDAYFTELKNL